MKREIKGPFYVYILFNQKTAMPIYGGSTNNPKRRYGLHKHLFKDTDITPVMAIYKKVKTREKALKEEASVVAYLMIKYPESVLNKYLKPKKKAPKNQKHKPKTIGYIPRIKWKVVSDDMKSFLYRAPYYGDCASISKHCKYDPERIRQVFIRKPGKLHPDLYFAINEYQKKRIKEGI